MSQENDKHYADKGKKRVVVISADSHDGPPYDMGRYTPYMDPQYRQTYKDWLQGESGAKAAAVSRNGGPTLMNSDTGHYESQSSSAYRRWYEEMMIGRMGVDRNWHQQAFDRYFAQDPPILDPAQRAAAVESQGIVAEVINTSGLITGTRDQFGGDNRELLRAGTRAHLRWLADFSAALPGRVASPIYIDGYNLDDSFGDVAWAREHGIFGGVYLPIQRMATTGSGMAGRVTHFVGAPLPPYMDAYWERLWSLCEDLDLPVVIHVGQNVAPDIATAYGDDPNAFWIMSAFDNGYFAKRPFFQMIAGGVFDRHPRLKFCATEIHVASLPGLFREADHQTLGFSNFQRRGVKLPPSEYWRRNGYAAASLISPYEVGLRKEIGIDNLMFGSDFPHPEGAWPNTLAVQRYLFAGVPEAELRAILGENAARCFGFDLVKLQTLADRVGPTVADLSRPLSDAEKPPFATTFSLQTEAA